MITQESMMHDADAAVDIYSKMEQDIYARIIQTLKTTKFDTVDSKNVLRWQVEQLAKMGVLNEQVIELVAKYVGQSKQAIEKLVHDDGLEVVDTVDATLSEQLHKKVAVDNDIQDALNSMQNQTWRDLNNTVNQSLLSTNYGENGAMRAYQSIIKQSTMETTVGLKTHEKALSDAVYKMVDSGLKSNLVDKGGHQWSVEGYARTVIQTTAHKTYNNLRLKRMQDFGTTLAVMSAHPAAREACAPIQGQVVNLTAPGSDSYNPKYDSIYNHGYGTPAGTQGINCSHELYPFIEGVNTNNQPQYDPEEAKANGDIQAKQRGYERAIRQTKKKLAAAEELGDKDSVAHYKSVLSNQRANLRNLVKAHDFLHRDYSREKIYHADHNAKVNNPNKSSYDFVNKDSISKLGRSTSTEINKVLSSAPNDYQALWRKFGPKMKIADVAEESKGRSYFRPSTGEVRFLRKDLNGNNSQKKLDVYFHEMAHLIDSKAGDVSVNRLKPVLDRDYADYMNRRYDQVRRSITVDSDKVVTIGNKHYVDGLEVKFGKRGVLSKKSVELLAKTYLNRELVKGHKLNAIGDISDLMTVGAGKSKAVLGGAHKAGYFKVAGRQDKEAFAEMTSATINNPESLELIKKIFPNAYKEYQSIITELAKESKPKTTAAVGNHKQISKPKPVVKPKPKPKLKSGFEDKNPSYSKVTSGNLTDDDKQAISSYYHGEAYDVNSSLRYDEPLSSNSTAKGLSKAISKNRVKQDTKLYRKIISGDVQKQKNSFIANNPDLAFPDLEVGDTYTEKGFISTSKTTNQDRFDPMSGSFEGDTELIIDAPKGSKALDIQPIADKDLSGDIRSEEEVILQHGSKFKVTKITYKKLDWPVVVGNSSSGSPITISKIKQIHLTLLK